MMLNATLRDVQLREICRRELLVEVAHERLIEHASMPHLRRQHLPSLWFLLTIH